MTECCHFDSLLSMPLMARLRVDNLSRKPADRRQDADIAPVSRIPTLTA